MLRQPSPARAQASQPQSHPEFVEGRIRHNPTVPINPVSAMDPMKNRAERAGLRAPPKCRDELLKRLVLPLAVAP
jgi:hypothetical protein